MNEDFIPLGMIFLAFLVGSALTYASDKNMINNSYVTGYCHALHYNAGIKVNDKLMCYTSTTSAVFDDASKGK